MRKFIIFIILFVANCGYQPLYVKKDNSDLVFKELQLLGNKEINRKIVSFIKIKEDKNNSSINNLLLKSKQYIIETSKDSKGRVSTLRTTVETIVTISNKDKIIEKKVFSESFSYNNKDNKFDLEKYQTEIKDNLTDKIIEKMIIYFSFR